MLLEETAFRFFFFLLAGCIIRDNTGHRNETRQT